MNVILGVVKQIAFSALCNSLFLNGMFFYILRPSDCARPRALKILKVEFVKKHKNHEDWRLRKYTAPTRY